MRIRMSYKKFNSINIFLRLREQVQKKKRRRKTDKWKINAFLCHVDYKCLFVCVWYPFAQAVPVIIAHINRTVSPYPKIQLTCIKVQEKKKKKRKKEIVTYTYTYTYVYYIIYIYAIYACHIYMPTHMRS